MGDWSAAPWDNDEAADWFERYWNGGGMELVLRTIHEFRADTEQYDAVRAACVVLACFGSAYAWPYAYLEQRLPTLQAAITILQNMLLSPSEEWGFLDMWDNNVEVVAAVEEQIRQLQQHVSLQ